MRTPATLSGLPVGRTVTIRLDLPGYDPASDRARLESGQRARVFLSLREAVGTVRIMAIGRRVTAYLDDRAVDPGKPFSASVGMHKLRVESGGTLLIAEPIEVRAGAEMVIDVDEGLRHR